MENKLLEWIKIVGPIIISWPTVALLFIIVFHNPLLKLFDRFIASDESTASLGPLKISLGKFVSALNSTGQVDSDVDEKIDLSQAIGKIRDTGPEGSTVGFCVAYGMQAAIKEKTGKDIVLSPQSIYVAARRYDEFPGENHTGTSITGALTAMKKVGAYLESDWPYSSKTQPASAKKIEYRISGYDKLTGIEQIIDALRGNRVVVASIMITQDFTNVGSDGRVVLRVPTDQTIGAKTICIVGYDRRQAEFKFANDWGESWGENGFGYIRNTDLSEIMMEAYTLEV